MQLIGCPLLHHANTSNFERNGPVLVLAKLDFIEQHEDYFCQIQNGSIRLHHKSSIAQREHLIHLLKMIPVCVWISGFVSACVCIMHTRVYTTQYV